jgi:integrase
MAFIRRRQRRTGVFYYVGYYIPGEIVDGQKQKAKIRWRSAGKDRRFAKRWAANIERIKRLQKAGLLEEEPPDPGDSGWTVGELRKRDLADARQRGIVMSHRESCWRNILRVLPEETLLTEITPERIRDATAAWLKSAGNLTANRYRQVLRYGLRLARESSESRYTGDPFSRLARLPEKSARPARALTDAESGRLIRILRKIHPPTAATAELLLLTASRTSERGEMVGATLRYPGHKRGRPRTFRLDPRLRALLNAPRAWSRRAWEKATKELGIPDLRPHDLRHSAATRAFLAGATIAEVQELLGHRSPQMAQRLYTHLFPREMKAIRYAWGGKRGQTIGQGSGVPPRRRRASR